MAKAAARVSTKVVFEEMAIADGFKSHAEMMGLVSRPNLSTKARLDAFYKWRDEDGTKKGLLRAFPELKG